ncbi:MAG: 30S ribosomal protein S16 [Acidimicrobiia bacterium]|nr:30S ribosomal protein S16 [Acidimicrobiia bacterium]
MSVKIRLMRVGKKKQPSYRVVVADGRSPRDGRYIEIIGHYQPRQEPSGFTIDDAKVMDWLAKGAQPSTQVHRLLVNAGIWEQYESTRSSVSTAAKVATRRAKGQAAAQAEAAKVKAAAEAQAAADAKVQADAAAAEAKAAEAKAAEDAAAAEASADEAPSEDAAPEGDA